MKVLGLAFLFVVGAFAQSDASIYNQLGQGVTPLIGQPRPYRQPQQYIQPVPVMPQIQMQPVVPQIRVPETYTYQRYGNTGYINGSHGTNCTVQYAGRTAYTTCF